MCIRDSPRLVKLLSYDQKPFSYQKSFLRYRSFYIMQVSHTVFFLLPKLPFPPCITTNSLFSSSSLRSSFRTFSFPNYLSTLLPVSYTHLDVYKRQVLRRDYIVMLKKLAKENGFKEDQIKIANLNSFILQDKKVSFYFDANASKTLDVVYEDHKPYIALTNAKIPSYYMKDPIIPAAQPAVKEGKKLIAFTLSLIHIFI